MTAPTPGDERPEARPTGTCPSCGRTLMPTLLPGHDDDSVREVVSAEVPVVMACPACGWPDSAVS